MSASLVGSEMCIRDRASGMPRALARPVLLGLLRRLKVDSLKGRRGRWTGLLGEGRRRAHAHSGRRALGLNRLAPQ
eukprot:7256868-Alexandrium_andersonii.AAC.1